MDGSIFDSPTPASSSGITGILQQATQMANEGGPGANADKAQAWLQSQLQGKGYKVQKPATGGMSFYQLKGETAPNKQPADQSKGISFDELKTQNQAPGAEPTGGEPDSFATNAVDSVTPVLKDAYKYGAKYAKQSVQDFGNKALDVFNYFKNFHDKHQTKSGGPVTEEDLQAAKLLGIDPYTAGNFMPDPTSSTGFSYGTIYNSTKKETLTAQQKAEKNRLDNPNWHNLDIVGYALNKSLPSELIQNVASPHLAATKTYHEIKYAERLLNVVNNPDEFEPSIVIAAQRQINAWKAQNNQTLGKRVSGSIQGLIEHPAAAIEGLVGDPSLWIAPEVKLDSAASAKRIEELSNAVKTADNWAEKARNFKKYIEENSVKNKEELLNKTNAAVDAYERASIKAREALRAVKRGAAVKNIAGASITGAGINEVSDIESQKQGHGFVNPKEASAAGVAGSIFGGVLSGLHNSPELFGVADGVKIPNKKSEPSPDLQKEYKNRAKNTEDHIRAFDENNNRQPGEALSPDTPISQEGTVPYYGGVDANGHIIHLDKNAPEFVPVTNTAGQKVNIPVRKTVAYHESVEYPLMHMEGPITPEALAKLKDRIKGFGKLSPAVEKKLLAGESLSYPEAHELATYAENKMVKSLYKVNPAKYQDSLKPYIKDIGKRSQKEPAADIPTNLDTKPYDDMGHPEQLKGQGNRPAVDKQSGQINKKLLATGVSAAGGSLAGSLLGPPKHRREAALLGGLAGLFGAVNFWGDMVRPSGVPRGEQGVFAGPRSTSYNPTAEDIASKMELKGSTPDQIWAATGYYKGPGGEWHYEIPDNKATLHDFSKDDFLTRRAKSPNGVPLASVFEHSDLQKAYPKLFAKLRIKIDPEMPGLGSYNADTNLIKIQDPKFIARYGETIDSPLTVITHEIQHAIQNYEGFPHGSSVGRESRKIGERLGLINKKLDLLEQLRRDAFKEAKPNARRVIEWEIDRLESELKDYGNDAAVKKIAEENYLKSAGENQSIAAQERLKLTPEERRYSHPEANMPHKLQGQIIERRPIPEQMHETSLSNHLQKTGEMDEDGKLRGMVLPEDHVPNEWSVVKKATSGDQRAIASLYTHYMPRLVRAMRGMVRQAGPTLGIDSEDIAHIAFTKAMQNLDKFKGDSAFYTWLYQIAKNTALNAIAKSKREVPTTSIFAQHVGGGDPLAGGIESRAGESMIPEAEKAASETDTPEDIFVARQASNMVRHALSKLPKDIREAIKMKEMEGMTEQEIAQAQGVPLGTVKSRLYRGRSMIQESLKKGHGAQYRKQGGYTTPEQLRKLAKFGALSAIGATVGMYYAPQGHKGMGAFEGLGLALAAGEIRYKNLLPAVKKAFSKEPWYNVNDLLNAYDAHRARVTRLVSQVQYGIDKLVPNKEGQIRITHYLDGDKSVQLTPAEHRAARIARMFYDTIGKQSMDVGVLKDFLQNYVNHEWGDSAKAKEFEDQILNSISTNMSPKDRHALARKFMTLRAGKAAGLVPRTENINDLIKIYGDSMGRAIANKNLIGGLKAKILDEVEGIKAMMPAGKSPPNYVSINHPQLNPYRVHPSIANSLDFLFHTYDNSAFVKGLNILNTGTKRMEVSISLFHPKALVDAFLGAVPGVNPLKKLWTVGQSVVGKTEFHKGYLSGGQGDVIDKGLQAGLKIDPRKGQISDEDLKTGFYEGLSSLQQFLDGIMPKLGLPVKGFMKLNKLSDRFIWENVHTGLKGMVFVNAYERMSRAWAKEGIKNPNAKMPSDGDIAAQAASFANDVFGGLNWRRLADDANTHFGRQVALALASPTGRRISQFAMFAPDWTYSTVRSWTRAFGKGSGFKGLLEPKYLADLHRQYIIRSALIYLTLYNAVNMAMSGHPIWDNKDPLTVDLGNGERMQANKHFMEVPHLVTSPSKFLIGKLGVIPSEGLEQLTGKEYLTTGYMPPMKESRIQHLLKREMPFSGESFEKQGIPEMLLNLAGFPVYGEHPPRTQAEIRAADEKKAKAREKAARTRRKHELAKMYSGRL